MPVDATALQNLLIAEVGDTPDNRLLLNANTVWQLNAAYAAIWPPLQRWYTKLGLIDLALGYYRGQVSTSLPGLSVQYQQRVTNLELLRADAERMIERLYAQARASRGIAIKPITQTAPELPPPLEPLPATWPYPSANDPVYQGDPYDNPVGNANTLVPPPGTTP